MNLRQRLAMVIVALLTFTSFAASTVHAQQAIVFELPDLKGKSVIAVTENAFTPLNFVEPKSGKAVGFEYELVGEICKRLNCTLTWKVQAWDGMIAAVAAKQYDVGMDGITITDERAKQVDFSKPFLVFEQKLLVRNDETRFKDVKELGANDKLKIGSQAGTTQYYTALEVVGEKNEKTRIVNYDSFGLAVQALMAGDVDAVFMDTATSRGYIGANPGKIKLIGDVIKSEPIGLIFPKGSDLVPAFNAALDSMKSDGFLDYLDNKWFFIYDQQSRK
jgi:polar amino acid transport system substrate-binding protein